MTKSSALRLLTPALFSAYFLSACMSSTSLQVLRPADVTLPDHVQKFVLVDRSRPDKKHQATNILEGVFTGEGLFADKYGAQDCLEGLRSTLMENPRFAATVADTVKVYGTGTSRIAPALDWTRVESICKLYGADALVTLETFDSNSNLTNAIVPVQQRANDGSTITVNEFHAKARVNVMSTWRVYDVKTKSIIDEFTQSSDQMFEGVGRNEAEATGKLPAKQNMVSRAGVHAGNEYGFRIAPQWIWVTRDYYTKKGDEMKMAGRYARANQWDKAADIWEKKASGSDRKTAGRASYDMAVAAEVNGNLEQALDWAKKSYTQFGNRHASAYIYTIEQRIIERDRLREQMRSKEPPKVDSTGTGR